MDFGVYIRVYGTTARDRRIAPRLRRYLLRDARRLPGDTWRDASVPWLRRVAALSVDHGVITVSTQLRPNRRGKRIARAICKTIQGSDVADFTAGHSIRGSRQGLLRTCAARER